LGGNNTAIRRCTVGRKVVKTSVYLPQDAIDALKRISDKRGTTSAEVLRRAIAIEDYLDRAAERGGEILIKEGNTLKHIVRP